MGHIMPQLLVVRCVGRFGSGKITGKSGLFSFADGRNDDPGKTMHVVDDDKLHGTKLTYTADKKAL